MADGPQQVATDEPCIDEKIHADYRALLNKLAHESQTDFDKAVLALSGGALGLSFAFTKDVVGPENVIHSGYLLAAWIGWGLSSASILMSYFFATLALRKAIRQVDRGNLKSPGGWYDKATNVLNVGGLVLFLFGLGMMVSFLSYNVERRAATKSTLPATTSVTPVPTLKTHETNTPRELRSASSDRATSGATGNQGAAHPSTAPTETHRNASV